MSIYQHLHEVWTMNQQEILRKIGGIIAELNEQHTYLQANSSSYNDLELELFMANANFLTDHIGILKKIQVNAKSTPTSPVPLPEDVMPTKPVISDYFSKEEHLPFADDPLLKKLNNLPSTKEPEPQRVESIEQEPAEAILSAQIPEEEEPAPFTIADTSFTAQKSVTTETEPVKNIFKEPEAEPVSTIKNEVEIRPFEESLKPEPIVFEEQPKPIIAEPEILKAIPAKPEFVNIEPEPVLTLNQRIAAQNGLAQTASKTGLAGKATQDLPALISLNDKLLFVKELFNGYNLAYAEAINILNRYTNFEQAEQFLKANYAGKNNWKDKPATAERFYELLRKRFS